jgi:hypothetical protein
LNSGLIGLKYICADDRAALPKKAAQPGSVYNDCMELQQQTQSNSLEYDILIGIEFKRNYIASLLGDLPAGWEWHTESVADEKYRLSTSVYSGKYLWTGFETIESRIKQILILIKFATIPFIAVLNG